MESKAEGLCRRGDMALRGWISATKKTKKKQTKTHQAKRESKWRATACLSNSPEVIGTARFRAIIPGILSLVKTSRTHTKNFTSPPPLDGLATHDDSPPLELHPLRLNTYTGVIVVFVLR